MKQCKVLNKTQNKNFTLFSGKNFSGIVPGHEIAGIIEEFGNCTHPDEYGLAVGDFVVLLPWVGCGDCDTCSRGINNECTKNPKLIHSYGISPSNAGGYSSHVLAHKLDILVKIPNSIPKHVAAMLPCSGLTVFTSLKKGGKQPHRGLQTKQVRKVTYCGFRWSRPVVHSTCHSHVFTCQHRNNCGRHFLT